ncbi:V-type ATP synthase subunit K [Coprothermobacter platensis]|uniref:V-type ATP synthase subunit K n=1 Tax=Coprothermobacter platensis TaxID=108819 RepID=UPI000370FADB|nr:V-type ATP synthase subunit K [Coprothermobacter platensis]
MIIDGTSVALIGAGLTAALSAVGSAWGVGLAGKATSAVLSEKPNLFGQMLVLQALPGTQGFYGFIAMFLALGRINAAQSISIAQGVQLIGALLPVMLGELISAYWQGVASSGAASMVAKQPDSFGRAVIIPALVETYAILSLLASILLLGGVNL